MTPKNVSGPSWDEVDQDDWVADNDDMSDAQLDRALDVLIAVMGIGTAEGGHGPASQPANPEPAGRQSAPNVEKGRGQPCQQGETAARSHCVPAGGPPYAPFSDAEEAETVAEPPPGGEPLPDPQEVPDLAEAFEEASAAYASVKEASTRFAKSGFDRLSPKSQERITKAYGMGKYVVGKALTGFRKAKELAVEAARERGMTPEQADRLAKTLGTVDLALAWTVQQPTTFALTGSFTLMKISGWVPVASLAHLGYTTLRNPFAAYRAAKRVLHPGPPKQASYARNLVGSLADGMKAAGENWEWFITLFCAAFDAYGDPGKALAAAKQAVLRGAPPEINAPLSEEDAAAFDFAGSSSPKERGGPVGVRKDRGQPCEQGETAARSHCVPASGEGGGDRAAEPSGDVAVAAADYREHGTRAKAFKDWFGDWENAGARKKPGLVSRVVNLLTGRPQETSPKQGSVVTDDEGRPRVAFHGTKADFDAFDVSFTNPAALLGRGFYFADSPEVAADYARGNVFRQETEEERAKKGKVLRCYLNIRNPFDADLHLSKLVSGRGLGKLSYGMLQDILGGEEKARAYLKSKGYDGIMQTVKNQDGTSFRVWVAFEPDQVKAVDNEGTFRRGESNFHKGQAPVSFGPGDIFKGRGQPCKPGETAASSGCIPAKPVTPKTGYMVPGRAMNTGAFSTDVPPGRGTEVGGAGRLGGENYSTGRQPPVADEARQGALVRQSAPGDLASADHKSIRNTLSTSPTKEIKSLGGGGSETDLLTLADGTRVVFKPNDGEMNDPWGMTPSGTQFRREVAASLVADALGMGDLVPPTVFRKEEGREGSAQLFVPSISASRIMGSGDWRKAYDGEKDANRAAVLDFVLGSFDRHYNNWMVTESGKLVLIDNGRCVPDQFDTEAYDPNHASFWTNAVNSGNDDITWTRGLADRWPQVEASLKEAGLGEGSIRMTKERFDAVTGGRYATVGELPLSKFRTVADMIENRRGGDSGEGEEGWEDSAGGHHLETGQSTYYQNQAEQAAADREREEAEGRAGALERLRRRVPEPDEVFSAIKPHEEVIANHSSEAGGLPSIEVVLEERSAPGGGREFRWRARDEQGTVQRGDWTGNRAQAIESGRGWQPDTGGVSLGRNKLPWSPLKKK